MSRIQFYAITPDIFQRHSNIFEECYDLIYSATAVSNPGSSRVRRQTAADFFTGHANSNLYVLEPARSRSHSPTPTLYACLIVSISPTGAATVSNLAINPRYTVHESGVGVLLFLQALRDLQEIPGYQYAKMEASMGVFYPFFAFADLYDFMVYAGFERTYGAVDMIRRTGQGEGEVYSESSLDVLRALAPFHVENQYAFQPQIMIATGEQFPLSTFHLEFPFMAAHGIVSFTTDFISNYNTAKLETMIHTLLEAPVRPISTEMPSRSIAYINHSSYTLNQETPGSMNESGQNDARAATISVFQIPPQTEIVLINSPGFQTNTLTVPISWDFIIKYLSSFSIEELQKVFPPFKSNGAAGIPTDVFSLFTATSGGIMHVIGDDTFIQTHCYKTGDFCPDLDININNFGPYNGTDPQTYDFVASVFGAYKIPTLDDELRYYDKDSNRYRTYKSLLWKHGSSPPFKDLDRKVFPGYMGPNQPVSIGTPNQHTMLLEPVREDQYVAIAASVPFKSSLSFTISRMQESVRTRAVTRHYILSCGTIDDAVQTNIRSVLSTFPYIRNSLHLYSASVDEFKRRMGRTGELLYDLFRGAAHPQLSPASPRSVAYHAREERAWGRRRGISRRGSPSSSNESMDRTDRHRRKTRRRPRRGRSPEVAVPSITNTLKNEEM